MENIYSKYMIIKYHSITPSWQEGEIIIIGKGKCSNESAQMLSINMGTFFQGKNQ